MKSPRDNLLIALGEALTARTALCSVQHRVDHDDELSNLAKHAYTALAALRNAMARKAEV